MTAIQRALLENVATGRQPPPARGRRKAIGSLAIRLAAVGAFVAILLYFAFGASGFMTPGNLVNIVEQSAILGVMAFGMSVVIIGGGSNVTDGGIDLSIAANMGVCAAVYAKLLTLGVSDALALPAVAATGIAIGLLNAVAVVRLGILPLLATLAVMNIAAGAELTITQNTVISVSSPLMTFISSASFLGISALAWTLALASAAMILLVHHTGFGLRLYAVGGHPEAARSTGIGVGRYLTFTYLFSGLCAALAAVLTVARLSSSTPGSGDMLLPVLAAALLGTVFSRRFVPTIGGTLLSVLFIGCLANGFQLLNVSSYWVNGVQGTLILLVVATTSFARKPESAQ
ncbi:ABC transporter permease [Paraburkholderia sp. SARCC-3016]|uniref:ABC transporter permease n=1 Tax=Paraburkholderia sp. SARCC-3016 TaxID=3058611 RepID=UPI0028096EDB|nr:ABC transporter permease [Paraburkholderia sp. SARCC-3016]MDQ7979491.1 ABC transporter permease [Paraburkholderia sp. SARCC-3016]